MSNTPRIRLAWGESHGMVFNQVLSWKRSQPCFFHFLFRKQHVFMFGCHWFCLFLSIFWAGWVVVSAGFLLPEDPSMSSIPTIIQIGGNLTEWHFIGLSPGSVPSLAFFRSISAIFFSARNMCLCLVVIVFFMFSSFYGLVGWLCQLPFLFPRVPRTSNTPRTISSLRETSQNCSPLGSL